MSSREGPFRRVMLNSANLSQAAVKFVFSFNLSGALARFAEFNIVRPNGD